ncbi:MAG: peptidylprolyl isomerase [Chthoniobacterales bacterium]|nr:peptidylprolyl isomerase [Chthoniobacterales bacterium]
MKRGLLGALLALVLGIGAAEYLSASFPFRAWLGHVVRRGELQALIGRRGIYDNDVERAWQADLFAFGGEAWELVSAVSAELKRAALQRLIEEERLNRRANDEAVDPAAMSGETQLLRDQFRDEQSWEKSLASAGLTSRTLAREVTRNLRARAWLEKQLAGRIQPNDVEVERYYETHQPAFQEPLRLRASHLFLAAPEGYPDEVIERQQTLIEQLAKRLANGESFPGLVAEFSEDEATKKRDGDLNYFAETRMLPEVFAAAAQLQPGQISASVRSRLGFHLVRLTEVRPTRSLGGEARPEIVALLENEKRAAALAAILTSAAAR